MPGQKNKTSGGGQKHSSTMKAMDDFLAASAVPAGHKEKAEYDKQNQERLKELKEKYLETMYTPSVQINFEQLGRIYIICSMFSGMAAGTAGFAAFEGILFMFTVSTMTGLLVGLKLMMGPKDNEGNSKYFRNAFSVAFSNAFGNTMTFLLFWIMFYNVVHVV